MPRTPRYIDLAAQLRKSITTGKIKVGAQLETEHALCEKHNVSRHTARSALQLLEDAGLIERRPGLGTRVISKGEAPAFSLPLGGLDDLLQYAHEARLKINSWEITTLSPAISRKLGAQKGSRWLKLDGVRRTKGHAVAATTIYVLDAIGAKTSDFKDSKKAITEHIEKKFGVSVVSIYQKIRAEILSSEDAKTLSTKEGQACLLTIRRYADASDRVFVISDTRHPTDRFEYEMNYRRQEK